MLNIRISKPVAFSEKGQKPNQEDSLFPALGKATAESRVLMVCDGMGGHEHGEVASKCVAETIGEMTARVPLCTIEEMKQHFDEALRQAYANLDALDTGNALRKMGTTLTFLAVCTDGILVAHIGDSRVYQFRREGGILFQTSDHSLVNELVLAGELTEEEAKTYPHRNIITKAVQPHQEYLIKATYDVLTDIREGDIFMLCCDGVIEQLDNNDLTDIILSDKSLERKLNSIKQMCADRNTRDNNSCYLVEIASVGDEKKRSPWLMLSLVALACFIIGLLVFLLTGNTKDNHQKIHVTQGTIHRIK